MPANQRACSSSEITWSVYMYARTSGALRQARMRSLSSGRMGRRAALGESGMGPSLHPPLAAVIGQVLAAAQEGADVVGGEGAVHGIEGVVDRGDEGVVVRQVHRPAHVAFL